MRTVGMGIGLGIALVFLMTKTSDVGTSAHAQNRGMLNRSVADGSLIALDATASDGSRQLTLVDPKQRVMCVYRIDTASGAISLQSVRNVRWDLLMDEFNTGNPSPQEIRALVEPRR